jgi:ribose transport system ATP-binding protein
MLQLNGIGKAYVAPVLRHVDLTLSAGEVVALTGENGAGKSTLSRIIAGLTRADGGTMRLAGTAYAPASRAAAEAQGVRMVLQELGLIPTLTVAENLLLDRLPARAGFVRRRTLNRLAEERLARLGLNDLAPDTPVGALGLGHQQLVEIARGLLGDVRVLILDEPTAMLTAPEVSRLFGQLEQLTARGVAILYITHRLDELRRVADRVVVLRDGALVADRPAARFEHDDIVRAMAGGDAGPETERVRRPAGAATLRVQGLTRGTRVRDVTLTAHAGEVLGLAGLVGAGRTELLRLVFGADRPTAGTIHLRGGPAARLDTPMDAVAQGIGLVPEDRKSQGLLLSQSLESNITVTDLRPVSRGGFLLPRLARELAERLARRLRIRAQDVSQAVAELSGGNQQKALLARWLHRDCDILLLDEPTRGVDIGARRDMYAEIDALAAAGRTLVVVSSDLRELMLLCDRIAVLSAGRLAGVFERGTWSEEGLLSAAFSAHGS